MLERLMAWLMDIGRRYWIPLVLLVALVSVLSFSLDEANWVRNDSALVRVFSVGVFFGWLLALSRYRGWFAAVYTGIIALVAAIESVAEIIPSLWAFVSTPLAELADQMNLRAFEFYLRVGGWVETLQAGENIQDTGLFVLILALILAVCGAWLMWAIIRQRQALYGLLPLGILLAVNIHLSRQSLVHYMVFLFCALLLSSRSAFERQHREWNERRVDYPEQLGLEWSLSAVVLVLVIVLVARAAPVFGTREGWHALSDWLAQYRERTEDVSTRLFSGVRPPPPPPDEEPEIYVNTPSMGEIGDPIPQGFETIMWVRTSDPPPVPPEILVNVPANISHIHYWRSGIYSTYTGRGWEAAGLTGEPAPQAEQLPETPPPGRYYLRQDFEIAAKHNGTLFSVNDPLQTSLNVYLRNTQPEASHILEGQPGTYQVISAATRVTANQLAAASTDYPPAIREAYLQLPDSLPARVRALSERLTGNTSNPYRKALLIQNYLRENYTYDLSVQTAPGRRDAVDYFLFDLGAGFCTHYATAMAVMLRTVDVPARVATGYAMGDFDQQRQAYRVPVSAAHAWVEIYFPEYGWIEFEPTANRSPIVYSEEGPIQEAANVLPPVREAEVSKAQPYLYLAGVILGAVALLALPFLLLRLFTPSRQPAALQARSLYRRMRRALGWAGFPALASMTPDEYLAQYSGSLAGYTRLSSALSQATAVYRETLYSPHPPEEHRVRAANRQWQSSLRDWIVLWARTAWKKARTKKTE